MFGKKTRWMGIGAAVLAATVALGSAARADVPLTSFTPGDLVVLRGGDATYTQDTSKGVNYANGEVPVYLDEYTTGGAYVGTIAVPDAGGNALTISGKNVVQHEGVLNISGNGQLVTFAGYNAAPSTNSPADLVASVGKRIGMVGVNASSLDTSTVVNAYNAAGYANPYIRGSYTVDGTSFWTFGKYDTNTSNAGGLSYVTGTGPTATTVGIENYADWRDIIVANGQLYGGTGSSSVGTHGGYQIGTGTPTSSSNPTVAGDPANTLLTNYSGGQSASAIALAYVSGSSAKTQNGFNELYTLGDQSAAGIVKYYFDGTTWQHAGLNDAIAGMTDPTGLTVVTDPNNSAWVDIYVSGNTGVWEYVDESGDPNAALGTFTQIVTPSSDVAFYGMSVVPVPEPVTMTLLALGGVALLRRRRA